MEKAIQIQKQARDNVKEFQTYLTDLQNWESEMKRKEAALNGEFEQELPPVRSKIKKEKPLVTKKSVEKRIASSDYTAWDKFDVDKACEEVDMEDVGPSSLDSKKSTVAKQEKLREEAQYEKERGNNFVKQEKWTEAIACYNRAIELVQDDAIYYANRGLCHLKKESLHAAETDCTQALSLDPTYVKAYQRRATAREKLGSLRAASKDLEEVLKLEPHNSAARKQLNAIRARMGTKGTKSKSSPSSTPTMESMPFTTSTKPKIVELSEEPREKVVKPKELSQIEKWKEGIDENVNIVKPVEKPPHLRSKKPLKPITITEVPLGMSEPEKPPTRMKIIEITDETKTNNNTEIINKNDTIGDCKTKIDNLDEKENKINGFDSPESKKLVADSMDKEKRMFNIENMVPPLSSVQFMAEWKCMKNNCDARSDYLSIIDPNKIPTIFSNALESDVLSELLQTMNEYPDKFILKTISMYLEGITRVKRFSALTMFLSDNDKQLITKLLTHCKTVEGCNDSEISDLRNKFEL